MQGAGGSADHLPIASGRQLHDGSVYYRQIWQSSLSHNRGRHIYSVGFKCVQPALWRIGGEESNRTALPKGHPPLAVGGAGATSGDRRQ
ncbi:hypothetical protein JG687_00012484, partial [Phytophthora cactorum]